MLSALHVCALVRACAVALNSPPTATTRRALTSLSAAAAAGVAATGWPARLWPSSALASSDDDSESADASPPELWKTSDNIFARILRGEAPATVLEDGEEIFSFVDQSPAAPIHFLAISWG